jgi:hypothetical protein
VLQATKATLIDPDVTALYHRKENPTW